MLTMSILPLRMSPRSPLESELPSSQLKAGYRCQRDASSSFVSVTVGDWLDLAAEP
jgi:hypothetical protein